MDGSRLGRTLVIVNPVAHSGRGKAAADLVMRFFSVYEGATNGFEMLMTEASGDAVGMAAAAGEYDSVIALGGDGVIHEVLNGLMAIDVARRPRLGVIPMGSGNDYARTLGMRANDPNEALAQLLGGKERILDVGFATSDACAEGVYFTESLSFGLDAAIALDTTVRRGQGTRQHGEGLFVTSAIALAAKARSGYPCRAVIDGESPLELTSLIFATLNGPTYGGGFRICPDADPCDGRLDVCYNLRQPWVAHLMLLLGLARFGWHTRSSLVRLRRFSEAEVEFFDETPCQVDGEELQGRRFAIRVVPAALRVLVAPRFRW